MTLSKTVISELNMNSFCLQIIPIVSKFSSINSLQSPKPRPLNAVSLMSPARQQVSMSNRIAYCLCTCRYIAQNLQDGMNSQEQTGGKTLLFPSLKSHLPPSHLLSLNVISFSQSQPALISNPSSGKLPRCQDFSTSLVNYATSSSLFS